MRQAWFGIAVCACAVRVACHWCRVQTKTQPTQIPSPSRELTDGFRKQSGRGALYSVVFTTPRTGDDTQDIKPMLEAVLAEFPKADPNEVWRWFAEKLCRQDGDTLGGFMKLRF